MRDSEHRISWPFVGAGFVVGYGYRRLHRHYVGSFFKHPLRSIVFAVATFIFSLAGLTTLDEGKGGCFSAGVSLGSFLGRLVDVVRDRDTDASEDE